jgi:hypothetical protein
MMALHDKSHMLVPALPGLYMVTVACDEPISVNASDLRIADRCIAITSANCKFGRAKNLLARYRSYQKTFTPHEVTFRVVALLDEIIAAEAACAMQLKQWRVRGRTGRLNEWLVNIEPEQVKEIVIDTLTKSQFVFRMLAPDEHS